MFLRTDGFVSIQASYRGGELITKPLVFAGENLILNYTTSAAGSIRLEIQDAQGETTTRVCAGGITPDLGR